MRIPLYFVIRSCPHCHRNAEMPVYDRKVYAKSPTEDVLVFDKIVNLAECPFCHLWVEAPEDDLPW